MKSFLIEVGKIALGVFIVGSLIIGSGATSMKSQITTVNTHNSTTMSSANSW